MLLEHINKRFSLRYNSKVLSINFKGKPNCLNGLTFVLTGVYDSLEREEAADIIKQHGGKVTTSLSRKTSYIVVGEEAGLAKVAKAEELGTKHLTEDGLLDLIRVKSGLPSKLDKSNSIPSKEKDSPVKNKLKEIISDGNSKTEIKESPKKIKEERKTPKKEGSASAASSVKNIKSGQSHDIPFDRKLTDHEQNIASSDNQAWVEKYKPTNIKQIIGQQGAASNVVK